ncbi:MAG: DUF222 domain-containing protein [Acidimicrobiia bacterium]|nr:DUF222 domain-containing protein [Acidimicrobiia bacterium]
MAPPLVEQIASLGTELNANQYKVVRLAAVYDATLEWFHDGFKSSAVAIARALDIHDSTAREWIRVGHALDELPLVHDAFATNVLSYAKTRILTRWADSENEADLLELAYDRTANRLTTAIAEYLAGDETDDERDQRQQENRSVTVYTDAEGMVIIRAALPANIGKHVAEAVDAVVRQVAATPFGGVGEELASEESDASADASPPHSVNVRATLSGRNASADASEGLTMGEQIRQLKAQWQPADDDGSFMPCLAQQRADAFVLLFLGTNIDLTTEVVIHVRGDGTTFDDGTPVTNNAVCKRLDQAFVRLLLHDMERRPIDASNRRRHPTTRQKRVVLEAHNHECVDCQSPDLLELDHNPPYEQTKHTVTTELEPRCAPCHRARHRREALASV